MIEHNTLATIKSIHFIGIGGISMSGIAQTLLSRAYTVSGSDQKKSAIVEELLANGARVSFCHKATNIHSDMELVVYTAAISEDNEELLAAKNLNIPTINRAQMLGLLMEEYTNSIAISGTHGKTTTTSMISHILLSAKKDPTILVGGILNIINGNYRIGQSNYFVTEACEYTNSFLNFYPYIGIIQNVEEDHLDFFKNLNEIRQSFSKFINNIHPSGSLVINADIPEYLELIQKKDRKYVTYSSTNPDTTYAAHNVSYDQRAYGSYDLYVKGEFKCHIHLGTKGKHNVDNSLAAVAACYELGISTDAILTGLQEFQGTKRRDEYKGSLKGIDVIDSYAHHPTAIKTTIETARISAKSNLWIVFQPHTYTRTYALFSDFAKTLSLADGIILTDIYAAREKDTHLVHSKDLLEELKKYNKNSYYFSSFDEIEIFILQSLEENDTLITMGAGDVYIIGEDLLKG